MANYQLARIKCVRHLPAGYSMVRLEEMGEFLPPSVSICESPPYHPDERPRVSTAPKLSLLLCAVKSVGMGKVNICEHTLSTTKR